MKRRIITILAVLLMAASTADAQVFMIEDIRNWRTEIDEDDPWPFIPDLEQTDDQGYVPAGGGTLLLAGLAGAYLLGKKKRK